MSKHTVHIRKYLLPLSWLYGFVVYLRNKFFQWGILKQKSYDIPVICVGNLTVGGTGKTPHIEYLITLLKNNYRIAVLSRGYKRKTSGYILADKTSTYKDIGDEPYQMLLKFPDVTFAVSENRCKGIEKLLSLPEASRPQIILLDDAYQHKYVKPSFSILLTDYNRLYTFDALLPAGRLREPALYSESANIIIVTKCPEDLKPIDQRILNHELNPFPYQYLFYTSLSYGELTPLFSEKKPKAKLSQLKGKTVLLVTGIASPHPLIKKLNRSTKFVETMIFPDHHNFQRRDIVAINKRFAKMSGNDKMVVVTEKDAARLKSMPGISDDVRNAIYYLPIEIKFVNAEDKETFNDKIIKHVTEDTTNS
ncbi:tetraacyldisaccharide 4'-kinase [Dysgonomonas sp. 520]|uniref:tetraacyldisaccharide 4'-kinase n=1 Tax=Dysgonomonas sp. 520 TaxID=2302931 RepID=UPI0013D1E8B0|nr:tetraacyldisaccharide 4'-kinase [Dysgonomonas sp. 520]NDW08532.1 tetraacyldisaccharide 4'-kinase [Dysgonomonas sp. 520]